MFAVSTLTMQAEAELPNRLSRIPWYAPDGGGGFGAAQPPSWPTILATENQADALRRIGRIPAYLPAPHGIGAVPPQPGGWPQVWSTEGELDLQRRLSRLPFYTSPIQAVRMAPAFGDIMTDIQTAAAKAPDLLQKVGAILDKAGPNLDIVMSVVSDPALPQLVERIKTIQALEAAKKPPPAPGAPAPAPAPEAGVGLNKVLPLWDAAIFYEKYPWAPWAIGAGAVLLLGGIGFAVGRSSKRCQVPSGVGRRYRRRR